MMKEIAEKALYILFAAGVIVLLGFALDTNKSLNCRSFQVRVDAPSGNSFVDSLSVVKQVISILEPLEGKEISSIALGKVEELINAMHFVERSHVYRTIDGHVVADITQREPIARVVNSMNETFYIDAKGKLMKTSSSFSARVLVVTGFINTRYSPNINIYEMQKEEDLSSSQTVLVQLNQLVRHIQKDDFLNAWIDQIYVNRRGEFELVPRNGVHTIEFGQVEDMEEKFGKLMKFYKYGLTHVGWGSYKRINLKFKNQIVCSK